MTVGDSERPPGPDGVATHDQLAARLEELRAWAGVGYRELHRRVAAGRRARGIPEIPVFDTVRRALQPGRRRVDPELVVDVVTALTDDAGAVAGWRQACRVVSGTATVAGLVTVADQLPADPVGFTGRDGEVRAVLDAAASGLVAIEGMGGVGKTLLATRAAHVLARRERWDAIWSVDLRGYDETLPAADPAAVLDGLLRALGMPGSRIVRLDLAQRAAALRDLAAGRRVLVLLDNARSADQVLPLLPGGRAVVLVTSRDRLDLPGAVVVPLDVPGPEAALALLRVVAGDAPVAAEPAAATRIVELLGRLPLALGIIGARIRETPDWTLADHAERLGEARDARQLDDRVAVALRLSYAALPPDRRRLLRLLALHPGRAVDAASVAALAGVGPAEAATGLAALVDGHLVTRARDGRVGLHDLVRTFAGARAHDEEAPSARRAAVRRLLEHYLATALAAARLQSPETAAWLPQPVAPAAPVAGGPRDAEEAARWLAAELPTLLAAAALAAEQGIGDVAVGLSLALYRTLDLGARHAEAEDLHARAVPFAEGVTRGRVLTALGTTYLAQGRFAEAEPWLRRARDSYRAAADRGSESAALTNLGIVLKETGRAEEALASFETALALAVAAGDTARRLRTLGNLGQLLARLGRDDDALVHLEEAHLLAVELGDPAREAQTLSLLGDQLRRMARYGDALARLEDAARLARESGFDYGTPYVLSSLASVQAMTGEQESADGNFARALAIARQRGLQQAEVDVLLDLADAHARLDRPAAAAARYREAAGLAEALRSTASRERALDGLASLDRSTRRP